MKHSLCCMFGLPHRSVLPRIINQSTLLVLSVFRPSQKHVFMCDMVSSPRCSQTSTEIQESFIQSNHSTDLCSICVYVIHKTHVHNEVTVLWGPVPDNNHNLTHYSDSLSSDRKQLNVSTSVWIQHKAIWLVRAVYLHAKHQKIELAPKTKCCKFILGPYTVSVWTVQNRWVSPQVSLDSICHAWKYHRAADWIKFTLLVIKLTELCDSVTDIISSFCDEQSTW